MILKDNNLKDRCYGCYACANACPKKCIKLLEDQEGFRYPQVAENICNNCGLCVRACPIGKNAKELHSSLLDEPDAYACYILDEAVRKRSASGGMGFAVSEYVIRQGGVVFGAVGKDLERVYHTMADTVDGVYPMCGSKYVQSDIGETYSQTEEMLKSGCLVLYTGTPCQIAGLYAFLKNEYDNLITCDIICHGVPSQKVLSVYIGEMEKKTGKKVIDYERTKMIQYWPPQRIIKFSDASFILQEVKDSSYRQGFLHNLFQRKSCYTCEYAKIPRISDFSLADLFAALFMDVLKRLDPENKMGGSIVTVNTDKAKRVIHEMSGMIYKEALNFQIVKNVAHVDHSPKYNKNRQKFFEKFYKGGFEKAFLKYGKPKPSLSNLMKKVIIVILRRLRLLNFVKSLVRGK